MNVEAVLEGAVKLSALKLAQPMKLSIEKLSKVTGISKATLYRYIDCLSRAELLIHVQHEARRFRAVRKPDKLYLSNTNLFESLCLEGDRGTIRETFFVSTLKSFHKLHYTGRGDFLVDETYTFEVGGKSKNFSQIKSVLKSYL